MFQKILVPIQSQATDQFVFEMALDLAKQNQASLMLLHVFAPEMKSSVALPSPTLYRYPLVTDELMQTYRQRWEETETHGLDMLKTMAQEAEKAGVKTEFSQNFGNIGHVICNMAHNWGADLIVVHQPNRSKLDELFLGSVSNYVVHHAPCTVLTLPTT